MKSGSCRFSRTMTCAEAVEDRDIGSGAEREVDIGAAVRAVDRLGPARIDDDELRALANAAFHHRAEHRMAFGGIRADHHDDVRLQHRIEVLARSTRPNRGREPELGWRVADTRTVVDVVVAERGAHEFLRQEDFLVRATGARKHRPRNFGRKCPVCA